MIRKHSRPGALVRVVQKRTDEISRQIREGATKEDVCTLLIEAVREISRLPYSDAIAAAATFQALYPNQGGVYDLIGLNRDVIYVGQTKHPMDRITTHLKMQPWSNEIWTAVFYPVYDTKLLERERERIKQLRPKYNSIPKEGR